MTLAQVGKYMPDGVRALSNLANMLLEAAAACEVTARKKVDLNYFGLYLDSSKYWIGVYFSEPEKLWFETSYPVDPKGATKLGIGELNAENYWSRGIELDSEVVHFFARSKVSQMQWLEDFLQECLAQARSIETPNQPPIIEEPEES